MGIGDEIEDYHCRNYHGEKEQEREESKQKLYRDRLALEMNKGKITYMENV